MKKSTITNEMVEMIARGDQKAEIFAELLQIFGIKYQNLISQIMHFEYDYLREKYDPQRAVRRDISDLLETCETKGEIYQQLYKKYGKEKDLLITSVLEKDFESLRKKHHAEEENIKINHEMDYTRFFNLNEKLKVSKKQHYDYKLVKKFTFDNKALIGEIEIKRGKLFVGAYSYDENLLLTVFNFITVLNSVFDDYFILSLSNLLAVEVKKLIEKNEILELETNIHNKKILLGCNKNIQTEEEPEQYLLDIYYTIDSEMMSMTIIAEKYQEAV